MRRAPLSVPEQLTAYRRWGVRAVEMKRRGVRARDHRRPGEWGAAVDGQVAHHTGPYGTVAGMLALLWVGRPDLPGPLSTTGIAPDGTVYVGSGGRSNHAGRGSAKVLSALRSGDRPPAPGPDAVDGNAVLYGDEVMNPGDGKTPYPDAQVQALVRVHAARAEVHGWTGSRTIRHGGWTRRKPDIRGSSEHGDELTQDFLQDEVDRALRVGSAAYTYPPRLAQEDDVTPEDIEKIADRVVAKLLKTDLGKPGGGDTVAVALQSGYANTQAIKKKLDA